MTLATNPIPDKHTRCHRTGFEKTCFTCVTEHGCRLWTKLSLEFHPETGQQNVDVFGCLDAHMDLYMKDLLRRQVQTTASIDQLRAESAQRGDAGLATALMGINTHVRRIADVRESDAAMIGDAPQKLLEAG